MTRTVSKPELEDIVHGAAFLGTGGGGAIRSGMILVDDHLDDVRTVGIDEVEDDANVVVCASIGAPDAALERGWTSDTVAAFDALEAHIDGRFDYVMPTEIGAVNSIAPMMVTMERGVPTIDADGAGRAIPEFQQTTFVLHGDSVGPISVATGPDLWSILYTDDPFRMEALARAVGGQMGNHAGVASHPLSGADMKALAIRDTLTFAEEVGRVMRRSRERGDDPVDAVSAAVDGFELFRGTVEEKRTETRDGFDFGTVALDGTGDHRGDEFVMHYKNENMLGRKNGETVAMVPDRMCWMTTDGHAITNAGIEAGMRLSVIGLPAPDTWRTEAGIASFARILEAMGCTDDYLPIESLQ